VIRCQNNSIRYNERTQSANELCELMENTIIERYSGELENKKIRYVNKQVSTSR
jgi:hypothetical protein